MSLIAELRRRKVFRVALAYLVVAWLLIQVADTVAPQLNLPDWAPRFITLLLMLGFPLALVLAWVFDLTPQGIRAETNTTGNKWMFVVAGILAATAVSWYLWDQRMIDADVAGARTIAVLPFLNMSGDPENEYFSDGISAEILSTLARAPELRVAARTSSFAYKGQQKEVLEIARELNVQLVLEGSVRRQDDRVRITAQLIDASSGFHLWSETYDRDLQNIFAVQAEIAAAVARELELQLSGSDRAANPPATVKPEAYDKYLRARALLNVRREAELLRAAALFRQVIESEPRFAAAYAGLGTTLAVYPFYSTANRAEIHAEARDAAELALALDPGLAEAYGVLGDVALHALRFDAAELLLRRAVAVSPSAVSGHLWLGEMHGFVGDLAGAEYELQEALKLDPRSRAASHLLALTFLAQGRSEEARSVCISVLERAADHHMCRAVVLILALGSRDHAMLLDTLTGAVPDNPDAQRLALRIAEAVAGRGDREAVARELMATPYHAVYDPEYLALVHDSALPVLLLALGEPELALARLRLNAERDPTDVLMVVWIAQLDPLRCDARFQQMVRKLKVVDRRAAGTCTSN